MSNKLKMVWLGLAVFFNASGLKATYNKFTGFARGVTITEPKTYHQFFVAGNEFTANYKYLFDTDISTYNSAIYAASIAPVSPQRFKIYKNTFDKNRLGIYVSNINNAVVSENTITLRKPVSGTILKHYGLYVLSSSNDSIKINIISTLPATFTGITLAQRDQYRGLFLENFTNSSITDNDLSNFARHIEFKASASFNRVLCNYFVRGISDATPTNTVYLTSAILISTQFGNINASSNNYWNTDFPLTDNTIYHRFKGSLGSSAPQYYFQGLLNDPINQYSPRPFDPFLLTANQSIPVNPICGYGATDGFNALILADDHNLANSNNALTKSGEGDSTIVDIIENYEPVFDSTNSATDFFADMANYYAGLTYAAQGSLDSTVIESNYAGTITGDIIQLNEALSMDDSAKAMFIIETFPREIDVLDNIIFVSQLQLSDDTLTHQDSTATFNLAYTRAAEGGPGVISARNMLEIIVDEDLLPSPTPKSLKKGSNNGFWAAIYPNPSAGELIINTAEDQFLQLEMYDATGQLVYENNQVMNQTILSFPTFTNGLYSVILRNDGSYKNFKWVISK